MERLISIQNEFKREMVCRQEGCMVGAEHCPGVNADSCPCLRDIIEKLAEYEDLEEQGKLIRIPCKVGDEIFVVPSIVNFGINIVNIHQELNRVYRQVVDRIEIHRSGYMLVTCGGMSSVIEEFYKVTWFLTQEEAEAALEEMAKHFSGIYADVNADTI